MASQVQRSGTSNMFQGGRGPNDRQSVASNLAVPMGKSPDRASSPNRANRGTVDHRAINFGDLNILGIARGSSPARSRMSRAGSRVPGAPSRSGLSRAGSPRDPYFDVSSPEMIEKERRFERMRIELKRQFDAIDTNRDGFVDKKELIDYLMAMTRDR